MATTANRLNGHASQTQAEPVFLSDEAKLQEEVASLRGQMASAGSDARYALAQLRRFRQGDASAVTRAMDALERIEHVCSQQ